MILYLRYFNLVQNVIFNLESKKTENIIRREICQQHHFKDKCDTSIFKPMIFIVNYCTLQQQKNVHQKHIKKFIQYNS